jgi:hypothetical protein
MKQKIGLILLHPIALSILNIMIMVLVYTGLKHTWFHLDYTDHFHEVVEMWEGFGTILLGFGVILEERSTLRTILKIPFSADHPVELVCHDHGVFFVIVGVVIETFAWLIKIPNLILDIEIIEFILLNAAAVVGFLALLLQIQFLWRIHHAHFKKSA